MYSKNMFCDPKHSRVCTTLLCGKIFQFCILFSDLSFWESSLLYNVNRSVILIMFIVVQCLALSNYRNVLRCTMYSALWSKECTSLYNVQRSAVIGMYFAERVQRSVVIGMYFAVQCTALRGHTNVLRCTVYSVQRP